MDKKKVISLRKKVEKALEKYHMYLITLPPDRWPKITQTYSFVPPPKTNKFYSSTEDIAVKRIDFENKRAAYLKHIEDSVNRCSEREREILISRYMTSEEVFDYVIYNNNGLSERTYYRIKGKALDKLAIILGFVDIEDS